MNNMADAEKQFELAKTAITKKIETERITKTRIFWTYLHNKDLGIDYDYRKDIYEYAEKTDLESFKKFFNEYIKDNKYSILVMGNKKSVDMNALKKMGTVKELKLEEVFNY